jgi:DNA polymerase III subunit alpha
LLLLSPPPRRRIGRLIHLAQRRGIAVAPPDVNVSEVGTTVCGGRIRLGLNVIAHIDAPSARSIVDERRVHGPFKSLRDFCERLSRGLVGPSAIETLIKCGALASTRASRRGMIRALPTTLAITDHARDTPRLAPLDEISPDGVSEYRLDELLQFEWEFIGRQFRLTL